MRLHWRLTIGVVEAAMVIFVLFAAAWQFGEWAFGPGLADGGEPESLAERMPAFDGSYLMLAILLVAALYGLFQVFGRSGLALWTVAILVILAQMPGIWSHNKLSWGKFMGIETAMGEGTLSLSGGNPLRCQPAGSGYPAPAYCPPQAGRSADDSAGWTLRSGTLSL